ncbi:MAG: hypothetical protein ACQEP9_07535, partial [Bacillota bacterium]
ALTLVISLSGLVGATEGQFLLGSDYFGGGAILDRDMEVAGEDVDLVVMGALDNSGYNSSGVEVLVGIHWDKVKLGDTVTDDFNYQAGIGYNTNSYSPDVILFGNTSYQLDDDIAIGINYSLSKLALSANYNF